MILDESFCCYIFSSNINRPLSLSLKPSLTLTPFSLYSPFVTVSAMATNEPTANGVTKALKSDSQSIPSGATAAASTANEKAPVTEPDHATENRNMESEPAPPEESGEALASNAGTTATTDADKKWPGWPGDCVFRLIVPVLKVGSIIGRKGDLIKKMCEETRARIRVLDGAVGTPDRIVSVFSSSFSVFWLEFSPFLALINCLIPEKIVKKEMNVEFLTFHYCHLGLLSKIALCFKCIVLVSFCDIFIVMLDKD